MMSRFGQNPPVVRSLDMAASEWKALRRDKVRRRRESRRVEALRQQWKAGKYFLLK